MDKFVKAQDNGVYDVALTEIKSGQKLSHWMWFIFPQIQGLGYSRTADFFSIKSLDEAKAYMSHPILSKRLIEISTAVYQLDADDISKVFYYPDDLKFLSCMTLFALVCPEEEIFRLNIDRYYNGEMCEYTANKCKEGNFNE
jgi:uncharacterized protein (DUF1810 family)